MLEFKAHHLPEKDAASLLLAAGPMAQKKDVESCGLTQFMATRSAQSALCHVPKHVTYQYNCSAFGYLLCKLNKYLSSVLG